MIQKYAKDLAIGDVLVDGDETAMVTHIQLPKPSHIQGLNGQVMFIYVIYPKARRSIECPTLSLHRYTVKTPQD